MNELRIRKIAIVCHEANRAYCEVIGDSSQVAWEHAPTWQQESAMSGVLFQIQNPSAGPEASHEKWMKDKSDEGWCYGVVKDESEKTHPCMVPWEQLPTAQQRKDLLFQAIVQALLA